MSPRPRTTTARRSARVGLLAGAAALALSGCMKLDMNLDLQPDDTVDGSMTIGMSSGLAELSGEDPSSLSEQMRQELLDEDAIGDVRVEDYDDGEYVGTTMHFTGADLGDFGGEDDESLTIERVGDEFVVTGTMDMSSDDSGMLPGMAQPDIRIAITFPGEVTEHTGSLEGTTVTWTPAVGEVTEISARGAATAGGFSLPGGTTLWVAVGAGVLVLAVLVVIGLLVARSRRGAAAPHGAAPVAAAPAGAPLQPGGQAWAPQQAEPAPQQDQWQAAAQQPPQDAQWSAPPQPEPHQQQAPWPPQQPDQHDEYGQQGQHGQPQDPTDPPARY